MTDDARRQGRGRRVRRPVPARPVLGSPEPPARSTSSWTTARSSPPPTSRPTRACGSGRSLRFPGSAGGGQDRPAIAKTTTNRLVIFHDGDKQVWRWPSRTHQGRRRHLAPRASRPQGRERRPQVRGEARRHPAARRRLSSTSTRCSARVRGAFDVETKNETKRASKLMARMYAAVEKGYAAGVRPEEARPRDLGDPGPRAVPALRRRHRDVEGRVRRAVPDLFQDFIKDHTERDGSDIAAATQRLFRRPRHGSRATARASRRSWRRSRTSTAASSTRRSRCRTSTTTSARPSSTRARSTGRRSARPSSARCSSRSVTRRRDASSGEHYTSEENILKTLNPLFLDELRAEFDHILTLADTGKATEAPRPLEPARRDPLHGPRLRMRQLHHRRLPRTPRSRTAHHGRARRRSPTARRAVALDADWTHLLKVTLDHFYGIEIDEWPARIAETAMFLIDRQCDLKMKERFGVAPERLPIQQAARIVVGSALQRRLGRASFRRPRTW